MKNLTIVAFVFGLFLWVTGVKANSTVTASISADYSNKTLTYPFYPHSDTTGEIFPNATDTTVCENGYTAEVRHVSGSVKHQVYEEYGVPSDKHGEYEVDHFISLELGGNNDIKNLWAQPYVVYLNVNGENLRMGAREKDVVETNLHKRICNGEITLSQAEVIITTNWVGYYLQLKGKIQ